MKAMSRSARCSTDLNSPRPRNSGSKMVVAHRRTAPDLLSSPQKIKVPSPRSAEAWAVPFGAMLGRIRFLLGLACHYGLRTKFRL
jgi:hypothetical protein